MTADNSPEPARLFPVDANDARHRPHRALWLVTGVVLLALAAWAGSLVFSPRAETSAFGTPTPTKTPTPLVSAGGDSGFLAAQAPLPTFTPTPTITPVVTPLSLAAEPTPSDDLPAAWVRDVARGHRLDPAGAYIVVDQNNQQMHIVEKGRRLRILPITTGDPRNGWTTPAWSGVIGDYWGTFQGRGGVMADDGWFLFDQPSGSFLIHSLPYTLGADGEKIYKGARELGAMPASNGCIRLSPADAAWFSARNPQGVPIIILPYTGLHGAQG